MHFADFFAGSFGGACGVAVGYPLDTVKVRIQTQKQFAGIWHCIVTTIKKEGELSAVFGSDARERRSQNKARCVSGGSGGWSGTGVCNVAGRLGEGSSSVSDGEQEKRTPSQIQRSGPLCAERGPRRGRLRSLQRSCSSGSQRRPGVCHILPDLQLSVFTAHTCRTERARVDGGAVVRGIGRDGRLVSRDTHGRDQSPSADGRRWRSEEIPRTASLRERDAPERRTRDLLPKPGNKLPASVSRQHGGVRRLRGFRPGSQLSVSGSTLAIVCVCVCDAHGVLSWKCVHGLL
ncbi:solute carrier family 25 member 47-A isoform X2 [Carassius gibelio]|uniref:solute carrier family 25 member 47-A isoform X2 n=1 Tax=Carassius gibelio TaxID=101364 RepID=UPI002277418D|nr:solute carrier family 25 member 47-A isoform X2 [Carassius gibelio]